MLQRKLNELKKSRLASAHTGAPKQFQHGTLRKFRRLAESTVGLVECTCDGDRGRVQFGGADCNLAGWPRLGRQRRHQRGAIMFDALGFVTKQTSDFSQHVQKTRSTVTRGLGEVSAPPDRLAVAVEKHGQRPAAVLAKMVQGRHVDLVDVGPLLAINFDVDEQLVHDGGDLFVFEAFVCHDMAPVAGCVTNREQDRLVALLGLAERVRTPGPPVDRIGLVLQQIWTRLMGEAVFVRMGSCGGHGFRWMPGICRLAKSADWNVGTRWVKCKYRQCTIGAIRFLHYHPGGRRPQLRSCESVARGRETPLWRWPVECRNRDRRRCYGSRVHAGTGAVGLRIPCANRSMTLWSCGFQAREARPARIRLNSSFMGGMP